VAKADTFAFDHIDTHRCRVQQQVDHMVVEQVHFIHVQDTAVSIRQHTGIKVAFAFLNGFFNIQCTNDAIFSRANVQVNETDAPLLNRRLFTITIALLHRI
jgi:hypothetical protein